MPTGRTGTIGTATKTTWQQRTLRRYFLFFASKKIACKKTVVQDRRVRAPGKSLPAFDACVICTVVGAMRNAWSSVAAGLPD